MTARHFVFPEPGEDLAAVATRVFPGADGAEQEMLSWNLHLLARAVPGRLLPSDIVFTEPPRSR